MVTIKSMGEFYHYTAAPSGLEGKRAVKVRTGDYGAVFGYAEGRWWPVRLYGRSWLFAPNGAVIESGELVSA